MSGIFEKDYIMRQLEQFARVLQIFFSKKNQGLHQEAQIIIDQSLNKLLEDDSKDFQSLTFAETLEALKIDGQFNSELAYVVGDMLYEKAGLEGEVSNSKEIYKQAYMLFYKAMHYPSVAFPVTTTEKMSRMEEKLDSSSLVQIKNLVDQ